MARFRFPIAFVVALVVTGAVFWFLWALIHVPIEASARRAAMKIEFTRLHRDSEVRTIKRQKPELKKEVQVPTAPPISTISFATGAEKIDLPVHAAGPDLRGSAIGLGTMSVSVGGSDRDVVPLVRIEPDYPPRASQRGTEGWVVVQFTITPAGTVKDAKVVDAQPQGIFDTAAIKAVERWKYNPKVENGVAVERRGVQVQLTFKLVK